MMQLLGMPEEAVWQLGKVLPGQRSAAMYWFDSFVLVLKRLGFIQCLNMPSILKHQNKKLVINIHVDDELIAAGSVEEGAWLIEKLSEIYKLSVEGPFPEQETGCGEEMGYLKKPIFLSQTESLWQQTRSTLRVL